MAYSALVCAVLGALLINSPSTTSFHAPTAFGVTRSSSALFVKKVTFREESRQKLVMGINAVANAVKVTLGPKGRNVVLERSYGAPEIVNDGVTIAREISLKDRCVLSR